MAKEEEVNRAIPFSGELVPGYAVPPCIVESPVGKVGELGEYVEYDLPDKVPY